MVNSNTTTTTTTTTTNKWSPADQIIKAKNKEHQALFKNTSLDNSSNAYKKEKKDYQDSFANIIKFSSKISAAKKKSINCVVFHTENSDGIMSAYIASQFLSQKNKNSKNNNPKDITFIPSKPSSGNSIDFRLKKLEDKMRGRVILIVDLMYGKAGLDYFKSIAKEVIILDDHSMGTRTTNNKSNNKSPTNNTKTFHHFIGDEKHAAIAYTWKFFNPTEDVPLFVQIIDNDDRKLQLPFLANYRNLSSFYNYRVFHSPYIQLKFDKLEDFKHLDVIVQNDMSNIMNMIGHYYDELANNIKEQVARNAVKGYFNGHEVALLNYNDPVLTTMVSRQIIDNFAKRGIHIEFVVTWGYEYTANAYRIGFVESHSGPPKHHLPELAKKVGIWGGTARQGGGSKHKANAYVLKDKDFWSLFTRNKVV